MWRGQGKGKVAYYVAIEAEADTVHSLSRLTGVTTVQTNDFVFGILLALLFGRIRIIYLAYYLARIEYE